MSFGQRVTIALFALSALAGGGVAVRGQTPIPTNDAANPYRSIEHSLRLPEGRVWGSTSAVAIDRDGRSVWVAERCEANSCMDPTSRRMSRLPSILKFDESGTLVRSFGQGMLVFPHGLHVDRDGNIWVTDGRDDMDPVPPPSGSPPPPPTSGPRPGTTIGHQVFKFSPDGKLLLTLGVPGGTAAPGFFFQPNAVVTSANGDIFVAEGHGGTNSRIVKFTRTGTLIKVIGKKGSAPGEFDSPHALAIDSQGRLFVGDRGNNRIQILDLDGRFLAEWKQFSRPSGLFIDRHDMIYVADSESESVSKNHDGWKRGIRIGSAADGRVTAFIPDPVVTSVGTSAAEGVAVDAQGHIYGAEVGPRGVKKYVK